MLASKLKSPGYVTVMMWVPTVRLEVVKVAEAPALRATVPSAFVPSMKVTVPVGILQLPGT